MITTMRWCAVFVGAVGFVACGDDDNGSEELQRPAEAEEIISDEMLEEFREAGAEVYLGANAPDISGTYFFGDVEVEYNESDRWPGTSDWCHSLVTYERGENPALYLESYTSPNCDSQGEGEANYISGDDACFTLYGESNSTFDGCSVHSVSIFSACVADNGDFLDPQQTAINVSVDGDECEGPVGEGRLRAEGKVAITGMVSGRAVRQ